MKIESDPTQNNNEPICIDQLGKVKQQASDTKQEEQKEFDDFLEPKHSFKVFYFEEDALDDSNLNEVVQITDNELDNLVDNKTDNINFIKSESFEQATKNIQFQVFNQDKLEETVEIQGIALESLNVEGVEQESLNDGGVELECLANEGVELDNLEYTSVKYDDADVKYDDATTIANCPNLIQFCAIDHEEGIENSKEVVVAKEHYFQGTNNEDFEPLVEDDVNVQQFSVIEVVHPENKDDLQESNNIQPSNTEKSYLKENVNASASSEVEEMKVFSQTEQAPGVIKDNKIKIVDAKQNGPEEKVDIDNQIKEGEKNSDGGLEKLDKNTEGKPKIFEEKYTYGVKKPEIFLKNKYASKQLGTNNATLNLDSKKGMPKSNLDSSVDVNSKLKTFTASFESGGSLQEQENNGQQRQESNAFKNQFEGGVKELENMQAEQNLATANSETKLSFYAKDAHQVWARVAEQMDTFRRENAPFTMKIRLADGKHVDCKFSLKKNKLSVKFDGADKELRSLISNKWSELAQSAEKHELELSSPVFERDN